MSDKKALIIRKKIEISKPLLWLTWAVLFVFPSILAIVGFYYFKEEYIYFSKTDLINQAFDKIKTYNEIIAPESFLQERIKEIKKLTPNQSLEKLKADIDEILCGNTLFCMFFDKSADKSSIIKSNKSNNISVKFLKNYFNKLLKAYSDNKSSNSDNNLINCQLLLGNSLQSLFKTITSVTISKDKVSKNFSVLHGGELYFIFASFDTSNSDWTNFFAVMKGEDFNFRNMLKIQHKRFPEIRIVFKEIDVYRTLDEENGSLTPLFHSGIKEENDRLLIYAPASLIFSRHVLHDGKAEVNVKFGKKIPFIEYNIPIEKTKLYLKKLEKLLFFILFTILLSVTIYFFNISLFGFNPNLKFKTKIMIMTLVAAFFPFAIFSFGIYSFEKFNLFINKKSIQHRAEVELQLSNQELNRYFTEIEDKMRQYTKELNELLQKTDLKPDNILKKLDDISKKIPVSKEILYLDPVPESLRPIFSNRTSNTFIKEYSECSSKEFDDKQNEEMINSILIRIFELANEKIPERKEQNYIYVGNKTIKSNEISYILQYDGKLLPINDKATNIWYEIQQLHKKDSNNILGFYAAKFESRPILAFYLKNASIAQKGFSTTLDNYVINYAFIPVEKSGSAKIWKQSGIISEYDKALCLKNPQSGIINLKDRIIIKKYNQKIPHLAIATITELAPYNEKAFIIKILSFIGLYLFFILIFTNKLIDIIFIEPVKLLAGNASAIAKGADEWNTIINSGDEFEKLNTSFKNLVNGLKERNILKSYVSEDAFSDIEKNQNINLLPSGEYIEASIVFSTLKDYDKISLSISPQESVKLLSKFMSIAEEITKSYGGSIDKIIGDTIMLVFRNNPTLPSHGLRAAKASLELVKKAKEASLPDLYTGIASGRVISGKIGSYSGKLDFTVIGNPVNSAARFKAEAKNGTEQTGIIISGETIRLTKGKAKVKFLRRVQIKGKTRKYNIYELLEIRD